MRRKYERLRRIEQSHNADEFLLAEIQDYKVRILVSIIIIYLVFLIKIFILFFVQIIIRLKNNI